jgi:hypothetical protein
MTDTPILCGKLQGGTAAVNMRPTAAGHQELEGNCTAPGITARLPGAVEGLSQCC